MFSKSEKYKCIVNYSITKQNYNNNGKNTPIILLIFFLINTIPTIDTRRIFNNFHKLLNIVISECY